MKKTVFLIFAIVIVLSCNQRTQDIINHLSFNDVVADSDQLVIKLFDTIETEKTPKKVFKVDSTKINDFKNLLEDTKITDYCCCPTPVYSILFLKENTELETYFADTIEFKDKIRIYERSFQYSYVIEKQKWKNFLNKVEN